MARTTLAQHLGHPERVRLVQRLTRLDNPDAQAEHIGKLALGSLVAIAVLLPVTAAAIATPGDGWPEYILLVLFGGAGGAFLWEGKRTQWKYPSSRHEIREAIACYDEDARKAAAREAAAHYQIEGLKAEHVQLQVGGGTQIEVKRCEKTYTVQVLFPSSDQALTLLLDGIELEKAA